MTVRPVLPAGGIAPPRRPRRVRRYEVAPGRVINLLPSEAARLGLTETKARAKASTRDKARRSAADKS